MQRLEALERTRAAEMQRDAAEMRALRTRVEAAEAAHLCDSEAAEATPRCFLGASPVLPRSAAAVELTRALASLSSLTSVPPLAPPSLVPLTLLLIADSAATALS